MEPLAPKAAPERFTTVRSGIETAFSRRMKRAGRALAAVLAGSASVAMFGLAVSRPSRS